MGVQCDGGGMLISLNGAFKIEELSFLGHLLEMARAICQLLVNKMSFEKIHHCLGESILLVLWKML